MNLSESQKSLIIRTINVFETSVPDGGYAKVTVAADGANGSLQISYGRSQTTEQGHLRELIGVYVASGGALADRLRPYVPLIGRTPLAQDLAFRRFLKEAGSDPVMRTAQDKIFEERYFQPALQWARSHGFTKALSMLVIYDSFIHSGGILDVLRSRFPAMPPSKGGSEEAWIEQYVQARHSWLATHSKSKVRSTVYRMKTLQAELAKENWDLSEVPILANGVQVRPSTTPPQPLTRPSLEEEIPFIELEPQPATTRPAVGPTITEPGFASRLVKAAEAEWELLGKQEMTITGQVLCQGLDEGRDPASKRIGEYWSKIGFSYTGKDRSWSWSAAFISFIMREAGAGPRFRGTSRHADTILQALKDRRTESQALYWCYRYDQVKPKPGDLVCFDRDTIREVTVENQHRGQYTAHCDVITEVHADHVVVIGGNVGGSVTKRMLRLNPQGVLALAGPPGQRLFAILSLQAP